LAFSLPKMPKILEKNPLISYLLIAVCVVLDCPAAASVLSHGAKFSAEKHCLGCGAMLVRAGQHPWYMASGPLGSAGSGSRDPYMHGPGSTAAGRTRTCVCIFVAQLPFLYTTNYMLSCYVLCNYLLHAIDAFNGRVRPCSATTNGHVTILCVFALPAPLAARHTRQKNHPVSRLRQMRCLDIQYKNYNTKYQY